MKRKSIEIIKGIIGIIIGLSIVIIGINMFSNGFKNLTGGDGVVEYQQYKYGDVINKSNVIENSKFSLDKDVQIIIKNQTILSREDLEKSNQFNDLTNEVSVLTIEITNGSNKDFNYNFIGINYSSSSNTQLNNFSGSFYKLPEELEKIENLGAGVIKPGNSISRIVTVPIPDNESIKVVYWEYSGVNFTVELPEVRE